LKERLFLAVALTDDVRHGLAAFLADEAAVLPGRLTPPSNWHVTLRFLGSTEPQQRDRIVAFLADHRPVEPFTLGFAGLGAFPRASRASVLWLGVGPGAEQVASLAEVSESAAVAAGFDPEERPFHAHLTLSRIRPPVDVQRLVERVPRFPLGMEVAGVTLYRSVMGEGPVRYEVVDEVPL